MVPKRPSPVRPTPDAPNPEPSKRGPGRPRKPRIELPPGPPSVPRVERFEVNPERPPAADQGRPLVEVIANEIKELGAQTAGLRIWQWLSRSEFKLWPSLTAGLTNEQKIAVCLYLLSKGHAAVTVANQLGFMPSYVKEVWRDYTSRVGDDVMGITLPSLVGRIDSRAESLVEMAVEGGRPDRAWKIEKERVELLQDLGVVERAAKRYEVAHQHTLKAEDGADQETKVEVDRLLDLERKRRESGERVKRINARVLDAVPDTHTQAPIDDDD